MRILSVRLYWAHSSDSERSPAEERRERLSKLGFDTTRMSDDDIINSPSFGMTDEMFAELTILGEREMTITSSVTVDV